MILVDTSVWIEHLSRRSSRMHSLIEQRRVLQHPFVTGELACGHLGDRKRVLRDIVGLPRAPIVELERVLDLLEEERLFGLGLAWVDVHLLASARTSRTPIWTLDRALYRAAARLGLAA